jgi:hypothetical protein
MNRTDHRQTRGPRRGLVHRGRRHREGGRLPARGGETAPHVRAGTDFMVVSSDAIYPAGDAEDYDAKFYGPYEDHPNPIYALPGNHDWFDGLVGFMHHLCGAEVSSLPATQGRPSSLKERLRRLLWRRPAKRVPKRLPVRRRTDEDHRLGQRSPYFAIDTSSQLVVGIDTGMGGPIDREQGEWLRRISRWADKPKILLTGKLLYVDGKHHPYPIEDHGTVDEIIRTSEHNYIAAIGGTSTTTSATL